MDVDFLITYSGSCSGACSEASFGLVTMTTGHLLITVSCMDNMSWSTANILYLCGVTNHKW